MPLTQDEVEQFKDELYEKCFEEPENIYSQQDLEALDIVPGDVAGLGAVIQALINDKLFKLLTDGSYASINYQCRSRDDAKIYQSLSHDEELVYSRIDESGRDGIWSKTIKDRTGLNDQTTRNIYKTLEKRKLIKTFKNVEHPSRIMYMKAKLSPSERSTGGAWFTDNELDEELIDILQEQLELYIRRNSFETPPKPSKKGKEKENSFEKRVANVRAIRALRNKAYKSDTSMQLDPEDERLTQAKITNDVTYPYPASYQKFPTIDDCTRWIMDSGLTTTTMDHDAIQQVLDTLCWSNKIEKVTKGQAGVSYRAVRKSNEELTGEGPANGMTEAPCGRCRVFELCHEGGPVSASNCEYFSKWLDLF